LLSICAKNVKWIWNKKMVNVIQFRSQAELSATENLAAFISVAKDRIKLWSLYEEFNWDSNVWPTHFRRIRFHNLEGRSLHFTKNLPIELTLSDPFINFAKAYIRYTQQIKQTADIAKTLAALILLESALIQLDGKADITKASKRHFDKAAEMLGCFYKGKLGIGRALEVIATNIGRWHITVAGTKYWKHPFSGMGLQRKGARSFKEKLPEDDALLALAEIFANGYTSEQDDGDIYVSCQTCLLLSAPQRINEGRWYRTDLLREEKDNQGNTQIYLAYWVPKNGQYVRKEVPATMSEHTKEAIKRLKMITSESRKLAKHYENNSKKFYRHKNCPNVPDDQILTREQVAQALGMLNTNSTEDFIKRETGNYRLKGWTLTSLWNDIVLPKHKRNLPYFPYQIKTEDCRSGNRNARTSDKAAR